MIDRAHRHSPRTAAAPEPAGEKSNVFREGNPCEVQYEAVPHSPPSNDPMIDALFSPDDRYEERAADVLGKIVSLDPKGGRPQEKVMGPMTVGTVVACVLKTEKKSEGIGDADTRF